MIRLFKNSNHKNYNNKAKADIVDIFSSIQGEGVFVGAKQIFIRFKQCNLACRFCDESRDIKPKDYTLLDLLSEVKFLELSNGPHHSVSLTGGEPLLYTDFLEQFLKLLKKEGFKVYLETNGTLPDELSKVITLVDIIAMDFKLPSSTGEKSFWAEHKRFLKVASKSKVFVKVVVTPKTTAEDIKRAILLIKEARQDIPLILQPAMPVKPDDRDVDKNKLLKFLEIGSRNHLDNIRVIPQIHKVLGIK